MLYIIIDSEIGTKNKFYKSKQFTKKGDKYRY